MTTVPLAEAFHRGISVVRWYRGVPDSYRRDALWSRHIETLVLTKGGDEACRVEIRYRLKPGESEFEMRSVSTRQPVFNRALRAEEVSCREGAAPAAIM
ncbi:hypothetical protein QNA08_11855 [Chelatococcus sp. SYSU_G07232]|uniref:Uncharacterized protein n=1 Tax=Chelatococcus albus TaxID=3047466 RepID=A0ABT7AHS2_9HYPH|nr:hypothetical protein [Chelatococcus sp. SYSU_G07232]MDJ1158930.1 hypothetical protein [Chelatococcus sp. SYSU_G07232]